MYTDQWCVVYTEGKEIRFNLCGQQLNNGPLIHFPVVEHC